MSAPRHQDGDAWFPPPSTFVQHSIIPAEVLEPLLRRPAPRDTPQDGAVRSADGRDTELPAG